MYLINGLLLRPKVVLHEIDGIFHVRLAHDKRNGAIRLKQSPSGVGVQHVQDDSQADYLTPIFSQFCIIFNEHSHAPPAVQQTAYLGIKLIVQ